MSHSSAIKERIIESAKEKFLRLGFSRVTMDELCQELGISKKTLYLYFPSKQELLEAAVNDLMSEIELGVRELIMGSGLDFQEKLKRLFTFIGVRIARISPGFIRDLQKNAPELWKRIDRFRREKVLINFDRLLEEGIKKGVFRKDLDRELLMMMYISLVQNLINPEVLSQVPFSAGQVFDAIIKVVFEGIQTEKGKVRYKAITRR